MIATLRAFTNKLKAIYKTGVIKTPIHLAYNNEKELLHIFNNISGQDWIFSTWRSHYHYLLSGRTEEELQAKIMAGESMSIFDTKFFSSAIVGGNAPIALGVALALKLKKGYNSVWCFTGDMAASTGIVHECIKYAQGHNLPITYVIEDNGLSVETDTKAVWGTGCKKKVIRYEYKRVTPHAGTGTYVLF